MIPFVDLRSQYYTIRSEIEAAIRGVLESGQYVLGSEVLAFEQQFANYCQTEFAICVNSGTSALHLALLAANVGSGDEVITVPATFVATVAAIRYTGARPVFVDIDPETYTLDVSQIEQAITPRTRVIMPVHLYGHPADMDPIMELARRYGLIVIEDAAQAHGAEYKGRKVGSIGDIGCFSFYPGKNLGAYGEGGAVTTSNPEFAHLVRMLRDWGCEQKYHHQLRGYNYRMDAIQGAILQVKLAHLDHWIEARRAHAVCYDALLNHTSVVIPKQRLLSRHVYHIYAVGLHDRDAVQAQLTLNTIQTGIHYPIPVHLQPAHADLGYQEGSFPVTEQAARTLLSLPMFPELTIAQIARTVKVLASVIATNAVGEEQQRVVG